jgi:ubiquinone/menaquinone biosynthesis C-methylase UbiE
VIGGAQSDIGDALSDVGSDGDVIVLDTDVDALERLRATVTAANVSYLVLDADVLPLPDRSVESVRGRLLPAEEIARVTLNLEE